MYELIHITACGCEISIHKESAGSFSEGFQKIFRWLVHQDFYHYSEGKTIIYDLNIRSCRLRQETPGRKISFVIIKT